MDTLTGFAVAAAVAVALGLPAVVGLLRERRIDLELRRHAERARSRERDPGAPSRDDGRPAVAPVSDTVRHGHHHSPRTS